VAQRTLAWTAEVEFFKQELNMHRSGQWIAALVIGAACCSPAFAQRGDWRDDRTGDWRNDRNDGRNRWDWTQDRYRDYENRRRPNYVFGQQRYLERLSSDLYRQANSICWEMHQYYQSNRDFRVTYAEMYQIRESALRVSGWVRDSNFRRRENERIQRELYDMDKLFQHVQRDVRRWRTDYREASRGGDLRFKMETCEDTLHQLMEDYGAKSRREDRNDRDHDHRL
jgi:hypothetical protein